MEGEQCRRERNKIEEKDEEELGSFSLVFSDLFQAMSKIIKLFQNMANDGEFVGVMDNLLAEFQTEV